MNVAQEVALIQLSKRYKTEFDWDWFTPQFDLPPGYVAGWIGGPKRLLYVGVSPEGEISS